MLNRNQNSMSWLGWAGFWAFILFIAFLLNMSFRQSMFEWQEVGVPIAGKVYDKEVYVEETQRFNRTRGRIIRSNREVRKVKLVYDNPFEENSDPNRGPEQIYSSVNVSDEMLKETEIGDELTILVMPDDPGESILKSSVDNWNPQGFYVWLIPSILMILWMVWAGLKER